MSLDGIIGVVPPILATVAVVHVVKSFTDGKGNKEEYNLHGTYDSQKEATEEAKHVRADGHKARVSKSGSKYKVWVNENGGGGGSSGGEGGFSWW
mgnify:CR=1 FL=1